MAFLKPTMEWLHRDGFPPGPMHIVERTAANLGGINALLAVIDHKNRHLHQIVRDFPERQFVFFGDSGQHDPAIYANFFLTMQRQHPDMVKDWCIYIRKVQGVNVKKEAIFNRNERFLQDFHGVPPQQWMVFEDADELVNVNPALGSCYPPGARNPLIPIPEA